MRKRGGAASAKCTHTRSSALEPFINFDYIGGGHDKNLGGGLKSILTELSVDRRVAHKTTNCNKSPVFPEQQ